VLLLRSLRLVIVSLFVLAAASAHAQLSGSIGISGESTNNVQSLDTTSPDQILLPAVTLSYDLPVSGSSKVTFSGSAGPSYYSVNPALSYNATILGATGEFYLSNTEAIAASAHDSKMEQFEQFLPRRSNDMQSMPSYYSPLLKKLVNNDSLVDVASSALYTLSGQLDSSDVSPTGLTKKQVKTFEDLRDSMSDAVITVADLLDSLGYSESTSEVVVKELSGLRAPLLSLVPHLKSSKSDPRLLDQAIASLKAAKPETEYLPSASIGAQPSAGYAAGSTTGASKDHGLLHSLQSVAAQQSAPAPLFTLVSSTSRLREFGYNDISVHEDIDDSGATTLATKLTIPVAWSSHKALSFSKSNLALFGGDTSLKGNPNDYTSFSFGSALAVLPTTTVGIRAAYDYARAHYPFDSVYSNTENRFTLNGRIGIGASTVLIGEGALGFRNYITPLQVTRQIQYDSVGRLGKIFRKVKDTTVAAESNFHQFSYGLGISQFFGERFVLGALVAFNNNPNLRAYVTNATVVTGPLGKKKIRAAVQIADDEYTYDLSRYSFFGASRIVWDVDLGADISYEDRTYGSAVGPNGNPIPGGQGRTETGVYTNISLSKLIGFEDRLLSVFNAAIIEARLNLASVNSSDKTYSYNASVFTVGGTLTF
jgi:hypothetical protein